MYRRTSPGPGAHVLTVEDFQPHIITCARQQTDNPDLREDLIQEGILATLECLQAPHVNPTVVRDRIYHRILRYADRERSEAAHLSLDQMMAGPNIITYRR